MADDELPELPEGMEHLPGDYRYESLARGVPVGSGAVLYVKGMRGGVRALARPGLSVVFGRNPDDVQVLVGADDVNVSRRQGVVRFDKGVWSLSNLGRRNLVLPRDRHLFTESTAFPLPAGYTPVFIPTLRNRTHLVELYVSTGRGAPAPLSGLPTPEPRRWALTERQLLAAVATAQEYLGDKEHPEPWGRQEVAVLLDEVDPETGWTKQKVGRALDELREHIAAKLGSGSGLTQDDVSGSTSRLKHNLLIELISTRSIRPTDLDRLDPPVRERRPAGPPRSGRPRPRPAAGT